MKMLASVYAINAISFFLNLGAIFVYQSISGPSGYGTYGIYIVFVAVFFFLDMALVKAATFLFANTRRSKGTKKALQSVVSFFRWAWLPTIPFAGLLIWSGDSIFPVDSSTKIGGSFVMLVVVVEHFLSYPSNRLTFHWTQLSQYNRIYGLRLAGTLLRHTLGWSVLWLTESVYLAILVIVLKGVVIGIYCAWEIRRKFGNIDYTKERPSLSIFITLYGFMGTSISMLVMQEIPAVYINNVYGREFLGVFRSMYDVVGGVWFLSAIFPTILFPYLVSLRDDVLEEKDVTEKLLPLTTLVAIFHLTYFFGITAILTFQWSFFYNWLAIKPFALGVVAGIALLGYNRFLIEVAQANGLGRIALGACLFAGLVTTAVLYSFSSGPATAEIGWGWIIGQTVLLLTLKVALLKVATPNIKDLIDVSILILPLWFVFTEQMLWSLDVLLIISILGSVVGGGALIWLFTIRFYSK